MGDRGKERNRTRDQGELIGMARVVTDTFHQVLLNTWKLGRDVLWMETPVRSKLVQLSADRLVTGEIAFLGSDLPDLPAGK